MLQKLAVFTQRQQLLTFLAHFVSIVFVVLCVMWSFLFILRWGLELPPSLNDMHILFFQF